MTSALRLQTWKELRALLPWWTGMGFAVVAGVWVARMATDHQTENNFVFAAIVAHAAGCAGLGALAVGQEYTHRTLASLLALPVSRGRIMTIKLTVLTILVAALTLIAMVSLNATWSFPVYREHIAVYVSLYGPPLAGLLLAPYLTMLTRSVLGGAVFAIAIPLATWTLASSYSVEMSTTLTLLLVVGVAGAAAAWWQFQRLPVIDGPPKDAAINRLFERPMPAATDEPEQRHDRGWLASLVRKELRLQLITFALAALFAAVWGLIMVGRTIDPDLRWTGPSPYALAGLYGVVVAVLAGAVAAAEERHHGTADWQLLLPVPAFRQWLLKGGMALVIGLVLAIGLPALLTIIYRPADTLLFDDEQLPAIIMLTLAGLYASSMNTTGLRALLAVFPLIAAATLAFTLIDIVLGLVGPPIRSLVESLVTPGTIASSTSRWMTNALVISLITGLGLVLLAFGFRNYRAADRSRARFARQWMWLLAYLALAAFTLTVADAVFDPAARRLVAR